MLSALFYRAPHVTPGTLINSEKLGTVIDLKSIQTYSIDFIGIS